MAATDTELAATARHNDIQHSLTAAGVPSKAQKTTLVNEGMASMRERIVSRSYQVEGMHEGISLYPRTIADATRARLLFQLTAKEMFLSGVPVYCLSLSHLSDILFDDWPDDEARLFGAAAIFILDFYEDGAPAPLSAEKGMVLRAWLKRRIESGCGVSTLCDKPLNGCTAWWPASFLYFLQQHSNVIAIGARDE